MSLGRYGSSQREIGSNAIRSCLASVGLKSTWPTATFSPAWLFSPRTVVSKLVISLLGLSFVSIYRRNAKGNPVRCPKAATLEELHRDEQVRVREMVTNTSLAGG